MMKLYSKKYIVHGILLILIGVTSPVYSYKNYWDGCRNSGESCTCGNSRKQGICEGMDKYPRYGLGCRCRTAEGGGS